MGRTILPYSQQIKLVEESYKNYRRGLPAPKQQILDGIFRNAKKDLAAGVMASDPNPQNSMILSAIIDLQKQINELAEAIDILKKK
ncbi:hypothetical protein [Leptospira licerasiae]|uniref:hypothetical protein n=1 Tax=Leptospira licerasiae TaxID=447106 RepID=UPI0010838E54|nr:hypothetical protein [Leptospira licerasiae]TGM87901.1 hypothetical protein EHR05_14695 [Leptospira licerasiae]